MDAVNITQLCHQADGVAEGLVYAPLTLPGEVVTGHLEGQQLRGMRVIVPSLERVAALCTLFKVCGGGQLQHASELFDAIFKTNIVLTALAGQGLETASRSIKTSPPHSRRRAVFSARRTKKSALAEVFSQASDVIVALSDCQLLNLDLVQALPMVEALASIGVSRRAVLNVTVICAEAGLDVSVVGGNPLDQALRGFLAAQAEAFCLARLSWDDEIVAMRHPPPQKFGLVRVAAPPGASLQATEHGEQKLLAAVQDAVSEARSVVYLFCGSGAFTLSLAQKAELHAVDSVSNVASFLDHGWRQAKDLKKVTHAVRDLFRRPLLADQLRKFKAVVLNPPPAGAAAQVEVIANIAVPRIAYDPCNPVSFARESAVLTEAGFNLDWVQVVDQFCWSAHVELAAQVTASSCSTLTVKESCPTWAFFCYEQKIFELYQCR